MRSTHGRCLASPLLAVVVIMIAPSAFAQSLVVRATCGKSPDVLTSDDGLTVAEIVDGRDTRLTAMPGTTSYELSPGVHSLRARSTRCTPLAEDVDIPETGVAEWSPRLSMPAIPLALSAPARSFQLVDSEHRKICDLPCVADLPHFAHYRVVRIRTGESKPLPPDDELFTSNGARLRVHYERDAHLSAWVLSAVGAITATVGLVALIALPNFYSCDGAVRSHDATLEEGCVATGPGFRGFGFVSPSPTSSISTDGAAAIAIIAGGMGMVLTGILMASTKLGGSETFELRRVQPNVGFDPRSLRLSF